MFCPKCAVANADQSKYCRACGTNLETVALALGGQVVPLKEGSYKTDRGPLSRDRLLEKRGKGVHEAVAGAILLGLAGVTGLILLVMAIEAREPGFLAAWVGLFGWMAVWGVIRLVRGIPNMVEAKTMLRELERSAGSQAHEPRILLSSEARDKPVPPRPLVTSEVASPSVTEHTTELIDQFNSQVPVSYSERNKGGQS